MRNQLDKFDLEKWAVDSFKTSGPLYINCTRYYGRAQEAFKGPKTPHFPKPYILGHPVLHIKKIIRYVQITVDMGSFEAGGLSIANIVQYTIS